jgi:hypothetical protein
MENIVLYDNFLLCMCRIAWKIPLNVIFIGSFVGIIKMWQGSTNQNNTFVGLLYHLYVH